MTQMMEIHPLAVVGFDQWFPRGTGEAILRKAVPCLVVPNVYASHSGALASLFLCL